ncbi:hypothetical protein RB195_020566 [Necator americanus]|uniref:Uncharacterized protein n=1 Tax=Necator americanus TaxID=51031 RepID=A0ABR1CJT3_NECAM
MISKFSLIHPILLLLLFVDPSILQPVPVPNQPVGFNAFCMNCVNNLLGIPTTTTAVPPTTACPPEETTQNAFQRAGWETDDKGNVFFGTDDAKILLISVGSYWPFPKDYRKK